MTSAPDRATRSDPRKAVLRDRRRLARREEGHRSFWRALGVIGMVGWPLALGAVGGALLGHYLDLHFSTGVRFTLMLITAGVTMGGWTAWKAISEKHD